MEKGIWRFYSSTNRNVYVKIALQYRTWPWKVYNLAHGKRSHTSKDHKILEELLKRGIINEVKPW